MKFIVPWLAFALCLVGSAFLYKEKRRLSAELAAVSGVQSESEQLNSEGGTGGGEGDGSKEVEKLRADNAELHRLRNEVRALKAQNAGGAGVRAAVQSAFGGQPEANAADNFTLVEENAKLKTELEDLKAEKNRMQAEACGEKLFMLQTAIQQWALENNKRPGENVLPQNIIPYLRGQMFPLCPSGGTYSTRPYGTPPTCSFPGHGPGQ